MNPDSNSKFQHHALILMALPAESQGLFEKAGIPIFYTGIGKINATFKATELLLSKSVTRVVNLGTAGSEKFSPHEMVECQSVIQRDMNLGAVGVPIGKTPLDPIPATIALKTLSCYPKGTCGTGDNVEINPTRNDCDLFDMEAYAIAKVCVRLGVEFSSFKYITDRSDHQIRSDWTKNLQVASQALFKVYKEQFHK